MRCPAISCKLRFHSIPPSLSIFFFLPFFLSTLLFLCLPSSLPFPSYFHPFSFFFFLFLSAVCYALGYWYLTSYILDGIFHGFKCLSLTDSVSTLQPLILVAPCRWLQFALVTCRSFKTSCQISRE